MPRRRDLETLADIGALLNRAPDFETGVRPVLERLVALLGLEAGWVFTTTVSRGDAHQGGYALAAASGLPPALAADGCAPLSRGSCECQGLQRRGGLERGVNLVACSRLAAADGDRRGLEVHASVPLLGQRGPVGILNLAAPGSARLAPDTLTLLDAVGKQLGVAFDRSRLQAERTEEARYAAALEERQRLAQEIHDSVAQLLFAADLGVQLALEQNDPEARERSLRGAGAAVREALGELRGLVELLRPADLSSGLAAALTRLAERTDGAGATVHLDAAPLNPPAPLDGAVYRIAQEALHNALRHAGASNVWLRLARRGDRLELRIEDDGDGFDPDGVQGGLGLTSMRERARAVGGRLTIAARDPAGSRVTLEAPWPTP